MLIIQLSKIDRFLFWASTFTKGISIDKTEFNGIVEFIATTVLKNFGLYNSTFFKEISVKNFDATNKLDSTINHYFIVNCNFDAGFKAIENSPRFYPKLTLTFSSSLKGIMLFEKIKFSNVNVSGHNNNLALTFDDCLFSEFNLNNVTINQVLRLSKCKANSEINTPSRFIIQNSNIGKMNLLDVNFQTFKNISLVDSFISDIQFASVKWFYKQQLENSNEENRETFRQLKLAAEKSSDNIAAIEFKGNELYFYHKYLDENTPKHFRISVPQNILLWILFIIPILLLNMIFWIICFLFSKQKAKYNISNKIILWLARVSNNYGSSWTRPLGLIFCINIFFFILMGISLSNEIIWTFDISNINHTFNEAFKYPSLFFQLLNPAHDINRVLTSLGIDATKEAISWIVYAFDLIHRIIYAFLIYQLVVAFRKYVK